jgi:hypothetical protein
MLSNAKNWIRFECSECQAIVYTPKEFITGDGKVCTLCTKCQDERKIDAWKKVFGEVA